MEVETSRKLVLTYNPASGTYGGLKPQNIEMKFTKQFFKTGDIPGRVFPPTETEAGYGDYIKEACDTLNTEIAKLVDNAEFHIVEVKIIK